MHQALVAIIVDRVHSQFSTEEDFCESYLNVDSGRWEEWKLGGNTLNSETVQKIKNLFSDYEWMLVQKMIRQAALFPEKRNYIVSEYKRLKTIIAKKWIQTGEATVELITQKDSHSHRERSWKINSMIHLKISLEYDTWGYDDILTFHLPTMIQRQIEDSPVDLLEWVNENLTESYLYSEQEE